MPTNREFQSVSGFSLSGQYLTKIAIQKFSGLKMEVETSNNVAGNCEGGVRYEKPLPGPTKPGTPTFVAPIYNGLQPLYIWWNIVNPSPKQGKYIPQDLTFSFEGEEESFAEWLLIGVFPKSYELSSAEAGSSELATETIQLSVTAIERMK